MEKKSLDTGMYIIDSEYRILGFNRKTKQLYPDVENGKRCYEVIALNDRPCDMCPLKMEDAVFYNPVRKEWIYSNASEVSDPQHGECYHIHFQLRQKADASTEHRLKEVNMDEHIAELSGGDRNACAIAGYAEPGSPLYFANESMLKMLEFDSLDELYDRTGGMVFNTIHPDDTQHVVKDLTQCALSGGYFESSYRMQKKDGIWFWIVAHGKRIEVENGQMVLLCVCTEMNQYIHQRDDLFEKSEELRKQALWSEAVLKNMPSGYHRCAPDNGFSFLYIGTSFEEIVGWTKEEIEEVFDNQFANMLHPDDIPLCNALVKEVAGSGRGSVIYRLLHKDGTYHWMSDSTMLVDTGDVRFYQGTLADITSYIEMMHDQQKKIEDAMHRIEETSRAKSSFLFNVSHDIRTPMNAIQGFAHMIEENSGDEGMVRSAIGKILQSSDTLKHLLDDVLELSRIESGKNKLELAPYNLNEFTSKLYLMFSQEIEKKGIVLQMENDIVNSNVLCDELKCTRVLMNMLSNAAKFTNRGGSIAFGVEQLETREDSAVYRFFVRDSGIGMSKEFQARAFEEFEREKTSTESGIFGSGLGLAIIKKTVDLMGGECTIKSELGKGTEISARIRLSIVDSKMVEQEQETKVSADFRDKRILLVEDNAFNREIARYVLECMDVAVEEAENGAIAVDMLLNSEAGYYDLVLMDIQMPVMDGYKATREIRQIEDQAIASIPIIAMTANAFREDIDKCLEVGMNGHLGKPVEAKRLLETLADFL